MLTARRFWLAQTQLSPKSIFRLRSKTDADDKTGTNKINLNGTDAPNINNINILNNLHNLSSTNNINKKLQGNGKLLLLTNNEIRDEVSKNVDNFNNIDAMISMQQLTSKKDN